MHIKENQLVPELLLKLSDTLHKHIGILGMCMKKCHAKKKRVFVWLNNCLSNLAILYGLCILAISFLY